jgi:hypothetical protein
VATSICTTSTARKDSIRAKSVSVQPLARRDRQRYRLLDGRQQLDALRHPAPRTGDRAEAFSRRIIATLPADSRPWNSIINPT